MANDLTMRWVAVLDERGRTHLEARWTTQAEAPEPALATSHAA